MQRHSIYVSIKEIYDEVKLETCSSTTFLILPSSSGVMLP